MRKPCAQVRLATGSLIYGMTAIIVGVLSQSAMAGSLAPEAVARGWSIEDVAIAQGSTLDMELDSRGMAHITFRDESNGDTYYLRRDSPGVYSDWAFPYHGTGMLLDTDPVADRKFVLYRETGSNDLMLAWRTDTGAWTNTLVVATDYLPKLSFEMYDGTAHIAYVTSLNQVGYYHFDLNGSSWDVLIATATGLDTPEPSLAVRSDGIPRISFDLDGALYYATTTDMVSWSSSVVDDTSIDVGKYSSLVLNSSDKPSISYWDASNGDLKYAFYNSILSGWVTSVVDGATTSTGQMTSMALDPRTDYPRISYLGDCDLCLSELVGSGSWARTEILDANVHRQKTVVNEVGDVLVLFHFVSDTGVSEVKLAVDNRRLFSSGFEFGSTVDWSLTVGAP